VDSEAVPGLAGLSRWSSATHPFGFSVHQDDLSGAVARWIGIRRQTMKRPFLATLEKFWNPWDTDVLLTSAFHADFNNKMIETAELAGFRAAVVVFKGVEGSLTLSLARTTPVIATRRKSGGTHEGRAYDRRTFEFRAGDFGLPVVPDSEPGPRAAYACAVYDRVLEWVFDRR
jgi:anthranilate phosphoribosyltransferase